MKIKYPRTPHLPWSEGVNSDDISLFSISCFENKRVVVTEKMDGENTTLYKDYIHARSLDSKDHQSRHWVKTFWSNVRFSIPENYRVCGENLYAQHSIEYDNLKSYFYGFSIWNENNICLSWDDTEEWFELLGITSVPVLYRGMFDEKEIKSLFYDGIEGYVVRLENSFSYDEFGSSVAKFVRKNHVQTDSHWMYKTVIPNKLKKF